MKSIRILYIILLTLISFIVYMLSVAVSISRPHPKVFVDSSLGKIPTNIHQFYHTVKDAETYREQISSWKGMKGYFYQEWNEESIRLLVKFDLPWLLPYYESLESSKHKETVAKHVVLYLVIRILI